MDMSRPPQLAGVSPAAVYFSNAGARGNRRKRVRDAMAPPTAAAAKEEYVNLFTLQPQQHFHNLENRVSSSPAPAATALVSTGLRLAFDEQQQHQLQFQQESSKQMMNNNALRYSSSPSSLFASVSDELAAQVKQNDEEIDRFIREQGEQLRRAMADRLRRHNRAILLKADQSAARRLHEKAAEAEREARRCTELEERLVRLRGEAAAWQAKALSEQAAAVTLHAQLQQAAAAAAAREEVAGGEAESSCSAHVDPRRAAGCSTSDRACLGCRLRPASVVLLPCRHLSLCGECFAAGDAADAGMACPVCLCVRTGSVEAILC
ncbi:hypothetical protein PR202_gb09405 [Eleusine coracana subsp. coracana]|uniref:RING-type domain-containing protein n=1 Tax=Eleusine coracana subsp. coracana TaxID=191504 RepID=A0AAV5EEU4_ELECO|nr:hypothetical protein PR202_gb09405 [Eleusine coracana subsp. coracana]